MGGYMRVGLTIGALALGLALTACENFDPTDIFDSEIFNTKKKLPGERIPVFPQGTPGVPQGVPPELVKGYQAPPEAAPKEAHKETNKEANAAEAAEAKPKPKPKPKPKVAKQPDPSATGTVRAPAPSAEANAQPTQAAPAASPWPSSPQPSGGIAWPDPPAPR
jgi:hypothetical protein